MSAVLEEIDLVLGHYTRALQESRAAGEPSEVWGRYEVAQTAVAALRRRLEPILADEESDRIQRAHDQAIDDHRRSRQLVRE